MYAASRAMLPDQGGSSTDGLRADQTVAQVMRADETMLLATGCYEDRVLSARFAEKTLDSPQIDTILL
jgi:hypothetical protein